MKNLWDKVESALVGGYDDGVRKFLSEVGDSDHLYSHAEISWVANELLAVKAYRKALKDECEKPVPYGC